jgi:hypothetical protein
MTSKTMTMELPVKEAAKLEAFLHDFTAAVDRARKQMRKDQAEIDRLKASTRAKLNALRAMMK